MGRVNRWEPILMAGLGAMALQIDPALDPFHLLCVMARAFIGGAVGAYFGNHLSSRKKAVDGVKEK